MFTFEELLQRIDKEVKLLQFNYPPKSLYDPIEYILALGGKRIRPVLVLMACNLYKETIEEAIKPALGLEVFHNFTLLHDDLMDNADKRRNKPTVHTVWNANTAILSGDAMLIASYKLIADTKKEQLKSILDLFTATALEICGGQQYDMEFENRKDVTEAEYIEMIRLKTAVLLGCALKMGGIIGDACEQDLDHLYQFGICIGLAFQLQDDLLDVYGDSKTFGKNIGGDILCNKKTFMLIHALQISSKEQKKELNEWINKTSFDPFEKITAVTNLYNQLQLKEISQQKIESYFEEAMSHLNALGVNPQKLILLKEVCTRLINRQA